MTGLFFVQPDGTVLAQSQHTAYEAAHSRLLTFSELVQRVDPIHVYQIRPMTLWQAASLGLSAFDVLAYLRKHAAHPLPLPVQELVVNEMSKWGRWKLQSGARGRIVLRAAAEDLREVFALPELQALAVSRSEEGIAFRLRDRAVVKRCLTRAGYPVLDHVGYQSAPVIEFSFRPHTRLRDYQREAIERFFEPIHGQSGVVVLPCGAGKTLVGIGIMQRLGSHTLILTPTESAALQWRRELLQRTTLGGEAVALYDPDRPLSPVTVTTYQRVAARRRSGDRVHLRTLTNHPWGLVIYDEVHMLPAPLFRLAADLQSARRLGLTATLIREDGAESDVFSLIGGKVYEVSWKQLEQAGHLASVRCIEVHVPLPAREEARYAGANVRERHRIAALNPAKLEVVKQLVDLHQLDNILILGHYLDSLRDIAQALDCPLITGETPQAEREHLFERFRSGTLRCLILSRVANMSVDLPCASVAIQVSGLFGSRQEEAQRIGRLLRPHTRDGVFYSLISKQTVEERTAKHRQLFLIEQGYAYDVVHASELPKKGMDQHETIGVPQLC